MVTAEAIAPIFSVADLARAVEWYERVLGFRVEFRAADYAGVALGPVTILLKVAKTPAAGECHLRVSNVDEYVAQITVPLAADLKDRPEYGMREAAVRDPDGNVIYVGSFT